MRPTPPHLTPSHPYLHPVPPTQSQLSAFALVPGRSGIVRSADQEAALELLRPTHLICAR